MAKPTPGLRLFSTQSGVELIVVKGADGVLTCAGAPMVTQRPAPPVADAGGAAQVQLTKRYADAQSGLLVLCTRAGSGPLALDGRELTMQASQALPSSD
jgi:hypothetical protein